MLILSDILAIGYRYANNSGFSIPLWQLKLLLFFFSLKYIMNFLYNLSKEFFYLRKIKRSTCPILFCSKKHLRERYFPVDETYPVKIFKSHKIVNPKLWIPWRITNPSCGMFSLSFISASLSLSWFYVNALFIIGLNTRNFSFSSWCFLL